MPDTIIKPTPWPHKDQPVFGALVAMLLITLIALFGLKARNEARQNKFIGVPVERNVISISGEGKVTAIPDVATVDLGATTERSSVAAAQNENTRIMNEVIDRLGQLGVDKKDIQTTNYTIYPSYDYVSGLTKLRGFTVNQSVRVKVRDLEKLGDIIAAAGEMGANQVGGITFTVDDMEKLRENAHLQALHIAKKKAESLARVVGVKLRRVVSFEEFASVPPPTPFMDFQKRAMAEAGDLTAPTIEVGSNEIKVTATITYEIE